MIGNGRIFLLSDGRPPDSCILPRFIRSPATKTYTSESFHPDSKQFPTFLPKYNSKDSIPGRLQGQSLQGTSPGQGHDTMTTVMPVISDVFHHHGDMTEVISRDSKFGGQGPQEFGQHKIVYIADKKYKPCVVCVMNKVKSPKGWYIYTYYKCEMCDVPLCKSKRDCFNQYHQYLTFPSHTDQSGLQMSTPPHTGQ